MISRSILLAPALALGLSACATTGQIEAMITQVQAQAKLICGFLPTIETIALIISHSPTSQSAFAIANAICGAVAPPATGAGIASLRAAPRAPTLYGVTIEGDFVRR